ncbi:MAG: heavy-metal-associated domain-containing protein, partial [Planctomycetaceae bacterium]
MQRLLLGLSVCLVSAPAFGDEMTVKDVHLCCGACVKAVEKALGKADGVSELKIDKDAGTVVFQVDDRKMARAAMRRLANAGFAGEATLGGKKVALPKIKVEEGTTSNSLEITDVHLCCGGCVTAVQDALKEVKGVSKVEGDTKTGVVKVEGQDVNV